MNDTKVTKNGNVLTLERTFDASKDSVWAAYTTPEVFEQWWGPEGWSTTVKHFGLTPGDYLLYGMKCEDENQGEWFGKESWGKMVFDSIEPKNGFTYKDYFTDDNGAATEGMPVATTVMSFDEVDGKTKMTSVTTYETEATLNQVLEMGMEEGIKQTLDRLAKLLK